MPARLNEPTRLLTRIDLERHPAFIRLWGPEGFERLTEESLPGFLSRPGLLLAVFADSPLLFKETLDMAVIAPEIARALGRQITGRGFTDPACGRAIAARLGLARLPAAGLFRHGGLLGAVEGLKSWSEYLEALSAMACREAPRRGVIPLRPIAGADSRAKLNGGLP